MSERWWELVLDSEEPDVAPLSAEKDLAVEAEFLAFSRQQTEEFRSYV